MDGPAYRLQTISKFDLNGAVTLCKISKEIENSTKKCINRIILTKLTFTN